jgi:hypothetical protein
MTQSRMHHVIIAGTVVLVVLLVAGALLAQTSMFRTYRVDQLLTRFTDEPSPTTGCVLAEYLDTRRLDKSTGDQVLLALTEPSAQVKSQYSVGANVVITYSFPCDVRFSELYLHRTSHPFIGEKEMMSWGQWPESSIHAGVPYTASFDKGVNEEGTYSGRIVVVHKAYAREDKDRVHPLYESQHVVPVEFTVVNRKSSED